MERRRRQLPSLTPPWRRVNSGQKPRFNLHLASSSSAPQSGTNSPSNHSQGSTTSALPPRPRSAALRRVKKAFFDRPDTRLAEDLRSTKRRIIQIWRQNEGAPVQCHLGFRSRTGWEPIRAVRENQDCIVALLPWGPHGQYSLFAALDGHGRAGHLCSMFVAQRVISYLSRSLNAPTVDVAYALHRAIDYAEQRLQSTQVSIDCEVSGSTGVFVLIDGSMLYCANVGDSRAVLGRKIPLLPTNFASRKFQESVLQRSPPSKYGPGPSVGKDLSGDSVVSRSSVSATPTRDVDINAPGGYTPVPLSFDHKPERDDEKNRVIAAGGRVDAWHGVDVGAERVWLPDSRTPGLAVTRSFGDNIVKDYGVSAVPEIYSLPLSPSDSFIVIASDGVFEFLANYEVVSIASRHRDTGSPQSAAEEIVKIAAERWIEDDSVIDDISCIVVFLEVKEPASDTPCDPVLVKTDIQSITIPNTPTSTQIGEYIPAPQNMLFGQYSASSSDLTSLNTSRRMLSKSGLPIVSSRQDVGIVRTDSHCSGTAVTDIVRRYAERMDHDNSQTDLKRLSGFQTKQSASRLSIDSGSVVDAVGNTVSTPRSFDLSNFASGSHGISGQNIGQESQRNSSDIFQETAVQYNGADVSDDSERFEDAEEDVDTSEITKVETGNEKINPSDDEEDEKYADADTLVPIVNHKVVRRQEVNLHRQRHHESPSPVPHGQPQALAMPAESGVSRQDRQEVQGIIAAEDVATSQPTPTQSGNDGFFNVRNGRKGLLPRKGLRITSDFSARRNTNESESSNPSTSGRLRRLLPGRQRPRSAFFAEREFDSRR